MFQTIINKYNGNMFHGLVLENHGHFFIFAYRTNDKNYVWDCHYDYWKVL